MPEERKAIAYYYAAVRLNASNGGWPETFRAASEIEVINTIKEEFKGGASPANNLLGCLTIFDNGDILFTGYEPYEDKNN